MNLGVFGKSWRSVALGVDRERNQLDGRRLLNLMHLRRHARAGARTCCEHKVRNPDISIEDLAVERLPGLRG